MYIKYNAIIVAIVISVVLFSCSGGGNHLPTDTLSYSKDISNTNEYIIKNVEDTKNISLNPKITELEILDAVIYSLNSTSGTNEGLTLNNTNKILLNYNNTKISATTNTIIINIYDSISTSVSKEDILTTLKTLVYEEGVLTKQLENINIAVDPIQGSKDGKDGTLELLNDISSYSNNVLYVDIECRFLNKKYTVSIDNFTGELNTIKLIFSLTADDALWVS